MATLTIRSSNWPSGSYTADIAITYEATNATLKITEIQGRVSWSSRSYDAQIKSITMTVGGISKTINLSNYVDFGANNTWKTWGAADTIWTGISGNVTITTTMPNSPNGSSLEGAKFTGTINVPSVALAEQTPAPNLVDTSNIGVPYTYINNEWVFGSLTYIYYDNKWYEGWTPSSSKKVIIIGDRDGVPAPAIEACINTAGGNIVYSETMSWDAMAGTIALSLETQASILNLYNTYGADNLVVIIGAPEAEAAGLIAETLIYGDPSFAGPLAGVALGLDVYHICEPQIKEHIDEDVYAEQVELMEMMLDIDDIITALDAVRNKTEELILTSDKEVLRTIDNNRLFVLTDSSILTL